MQEISITEYTGGGRIDKAAMKFLDKAPKGFVYKMLRKKNIVLNGKKAAGSEILKNGDRITFYLSDDTIRKFHTAADPHPSVSEAEPARKSLSLASMIIYEDDNLIALNKPSGLLSQNGSSDEICMNDLLQDHLGKDDLFTPGISNRLDRNTSGLILAGKNPQSVRLLNEAIRDRKLQKLYLALAAGQIKKDLILEGFLSKDRTLNKVSISDLPSAGSNDAYVRTACHVISSNPACSLLSIDLITGRTHQIRAQLSKAGHGIIGDMKYGSRKMNELFYKKYSVRSQLLHAYKIRFIRMTGILEYLNHMTITAAIPAEFEKAMKGEGLCLPGVRED